MSDDQIAAASAEITAFIRELVKPWVDFRGHEENIAKILAKHTTRPPEQNKEFISE